MDAINEGEDSFRPAMIFNDSCLGCLACVAILGVQYDELIAFTTRLKLNRLPSAVYQTGY